MGDRFITTVQMRTRQIALMVLAVATTAFSDSCFAVDSYRYLHVTIDTPWWIFMFLLPAVLSPFILMAILYWRFANKKRRTEEHHEG